MAFSAAELQKRHGLEGAPDPFPTLGGGGSAPGPSAPAPSKKSSQSNGSASTPDTRSEDAFPSLAPSSAPSANIAKPAMSAWGSQPSSVKSGAKGKTPLSASSGGLGRTGAPTAVSHPFTDSFTIPSSDIDTKAMQETIKKVTDQTGAAVESSTQVRTGTKTFLIKAADQKRLVYARRMLERGLSKSVTIQVDVPITTLGTIIGPKGATLKGITDATQCKIDVPRRDTLPSYDAKERQDDEEDGEEPEEPSVSIAVTGPSVACQDAKARILGLIAGRVSTSSQTIKHIPSSYYPFIAGPKGAKARELEESLGEGLVKVHIPPPAVWKALERQGLEDEKETGKPRDANIRLVGEREKVKVLAAHINKLYEELVDSMRELKISIPKRQHRFLVGSAADDILSQTGCIVEIPPVDDSSDQCIIRGPQSSLVPALQLVMEKANAVSVEMVDVVALHRPNTSDALSHAKRVIRYLQRSSKLRSIADSNQGVKVFPPFASTIANSGSVVIEIVGDDKSKVEKAKEEVSAAVRSVYPAGVASLEIDPIIHSLIIGSKGNKISQFDQANGVTSVFPPGDAESSEVLLFYADTTSLPSDKKERDNKLKNSLSAAVTALQAIAKDAADVKTEVMDVEKKWHRAVIGPSGTVLNALIGEDGIVKVQVGSRPGKDNKDSKANGSEEDVITVRGPSSEVDRVVAQIKQIVEDAKNDDIVNGHTVEFSVAKSHVPHLVGQSGATINKLRETLGVRVNFDDVAEAKGKTASAQVKIVGRKEAVEEARRRLQAQIEKLEDETTETVTIKRAIQPALIGAGGKYAIRLEEKYGVKLSFPRDNKDGTPSGKPDEVVIRGGKKGVASAKAELLEAAQFETENRQEASFTVPRKSVAQIVGRSGATINQIKDETGAQIDIDRDGKEGDKTTITVRGDKKAIAAAKAAVLAVAEKIGDEVTVALQVEQKYHRSLIGQGGQKLRDTIASCDGPTDGPQQAGLVTFPRQGDETTDQVRLRGDKVLVAKIKAELEKQVKALRETKVVGVIVPQAQHASKIGRGGSALQDLQRKSGAVIHFPGSRQYASVGEIENSADLGEAAASDIVKVIGTDEAIALATEQLQISAERAARQPRGENGRNTADFSSKSITVPNKLYHRIADQPNLIRQIRNAGGFLTLPTPAPARVNLRPSNTGSGTSESLAAKAARIDLDEGDEPVAGGEWELRSLHEGAADGETEWTVRAKEEDLDQALSVLQAVVDRVGDMTSVGFLTGLPRSAFPRIIGSKGANINRMRAETGADIQVGKEDDVITIIGDEASVLQARDAITETVSRPGRGGRD